MGFSFSWNLFIYLFVYCETYGVLIFLHLPFNNYKVYPSAQIVKIQERLQSQDCKIIPRLSTCQAVLGQHQTSAVLQYILRKKSNRKQLNPKWQQRLGSEKQRVSSSGLCREVFIPCRLALYPEIVFKSVKCANTRPRSVIFSGHFQRPKKCLLCTNITTQTEKEEQHKPKLGFNLPLFPIYIPILQFMNSVKCPQPQSFVEKINWI